MPALKRKTTEKSGAEKEAYFFMQNDPNLHSQQQNHSKRNYQLEMEAILARHQAAGEVPTLLLHSCCAPCSSYVLETLSAHFRITVFYYNPNIWPEREYVQRAAEQQRFIQLFPAGHPISFLEGSYDTDAFYDMAKGLENLPEGGERCFRCYELRLRQTAEIALARNFDYFTTTLSISPLKNAEKLNEIGLRLAGELGLNYLVSDFKKRGGYQRSTQISREYGMYRQNYCGCVFSWKEREAAGRV